MIPSRTADELQRVLTRTVDGARVFGTAVSLEPADGAWRFDGGAGDLDPSRPFFIASTTKLFTTALIMQARAAGRLRLDDPMLAYLDRAAVGGLHVRRGVDRTAEITIRHLLAHTSGLPDYFQYTRANGSSLLSEVTAGRDQRWTFEQVVADARQMTPHFPPGHPGKAHYSDTNFQILGQIVATVWGVPFAEAVQARICAPLGLRHTYVYADGADTRPAEMYFKRAPLPVPLAMTSFGPDGGVVSTSGELLRFVKAFFTGGLFPAAALDEMTAVWNRIFFPLRAGVGLTRFALPRIFSPFKAQPELLGHSGLSGAFAFFAPSRQVFLAGTVNQIHHPDTSFRLMLRLLACL